MVTRDFPHLKRITMPNRRDFLVGSANLVGVIALGDAVRADEPGGDLSARARQFVKTHEEKVRPLEKSAALAWWNANVSGKDEDFAAKEEAQNKLDAALADRQRFAELKAIKDGKVYEPVLARQVDVLYLAVPGKAGRPVAAPEDHRQGERDREGVQRLSRQGGRQGDAPTAKSARCSRSPRLGRRKAVWEASKAVGPVVEADLKAWSSSATRRRASWGFANFHAMQLTQRADTERGSQAVRRTRRPDPRAVPRRQGARSTPGSPTSYGIPVGELRPWHYHDPFFQETPAVFDADLDAPYAKADILKLCRDFYAGIGLPIDDVIARSDLYEKPGKSPHAFCTDIDREGDVRVLANIVPNEYWMGTMLHELGHSVYTSKNIPGSVPYVLRAEAHILTTEGVAMMFERFAKDADWL